MTKSVVTEREDLKKAIRIATDALAFYANPDVYLIRYNSPSKTSVVVIDGGLLARMALDELVPYLSVETWKAMRRGQLMAGDED